MINRIRRAVYWGIAAKRFRDNDFSGTINLINKMRVAGALKYHHKAMLGAALLLDRQFDSSKVYLEEAKSETDKSDDPNARYVNLYCRSCLTNDDHEIDIIVSEAKSIECHESFRRWFPM